jgi:hypothetical protein
MLTLQRHPHILERGQMREYRRNLERAHQAEASHVGWSHRSNIPALVQDFAGRGLQELGQEVEACGFAGPVRTDQRMNTAAANPKIDIANREEARELLGQSLGFENELIGQSNFPHQPRGEVPFARGQFLLSPAGSPRTPWKIRPGPAASVAEYAVNRPAYARCKAGHRAEGLGLRIRQ